MKFMEVVSRKNINQPISYLGEMVEFTLEGNGGKPFMGFIIQVRDAANLQDQVRHDTQSIQDDT